MKKILSIMLALILVLSMATVAFATEAGSDVTPPAEVDKEESTTTTYTDATTVTLKKKYTATNAGTKNPAEIFTFENLICTSVTDAAEGVNTANAPMPTLASVSFAAGEASATKDIIIELPEYSSVGIYTYTFNEVPGTSAGVTYNTDTITLRVTVIEQDGKVRVAAIHTEAGANGKGDAKKDTFENVYSAGSLAVSKEVTGNMGDKDKEFKVTVEFNAPEGKSVKEAISYIEDGNAKTIDTSAWANGKTSVEISLKDAETITFTNIPYEVTYTVVEEDYTGNNGGYEPAKYTFTDEGGDKGKIDSASETVKITNEKTTEVDMGVTLDSLPYILMLVVVCGAMFMLFTKKRAAREN